MGGLAAEEAGGDFKTGAVAAGLNEAVVDTLAQHYAEMQPEKKQQLLVMNSQLLGVMAAAASTTGKTNVAAGTGTFPDEVFTGKEPHQTTPGAGSALQERYNPATGKLEKSVIENDQYGRQVKRTDYTNHGYGNKGKPAEYHSDPHAHTYEYGPG
ncbi:hypothetical protein [Pseudomonas sp.]|uniref:hypothetical protein n=1 Tax=Pseudomonas sp. TaxID=306 RepID=UPI0028A5FB9B|nr:hypothetical protein [Pseudomonas sp.]